MTKPQAPEFESRHMDEYLSPIKDTQYLLEMYQTGKIAAAEKSALLIVKTNPKNYIALNILGAIATDKKNLILAKRYLEQAIKIQPENPATRNNYGNILRELAQHQLALNEYEKARTIQHSYTDAWVNEGLVLFELGRYQEAIIALAKAINLDPTQQSAQTFLAHTLMALERYDEALQGYEQAIILDKTKPAGYLNLGAALYQLKQYKHAIACFEHAVNLNPADYEAIYKLGIAQQEYGLDIDAIESYLTTLKLKPNHVKALNNIGAAYESTKKLDLSIKVRTQAHKLDPNFKWLAGALFHVKQRVCDWTNYDETRSALKEKIESCEPVVTPFTSLAIFDEPSLQKNTASIWIQETCPKSDAIGVLKKPKRKSKINIGYFSPDFREHPVAELIIETIERHDLNQFNVHCFSFKNDTKDLMQQRIAKSSQNYYDVTNHSDREITQLSHELDLDIAVDLAGITQNARTGVFALRAAPIQINYLGYPGTIGAEFIDYIIGDKYITPELYSTQYTEKIVELPFFQANPQRLTDRENTKNRAEYGFGPNDTILCSMNNSYKITPNVFLAWCSILKAVPSSVLWIYAEHELTKANLTKEAKRAGIDTKRITFAGWSPRKEYLNRLSLPDLYLDTYPFNGGTTASDVLSHGLPLLTISGKVYASRMAGSVLTALRMEELICANLNEYIIKATYLAENKTKLVELKQKLLQNLSSTSIFNPTSFTRNLEQAYQAVYQTWEKGFPPKRIVIN